VPANTPSQWQSETTGADVILITHAAFKDAARSLKAQHEAAGWKVALAEVEDIYDEFSFGNKTPVALKDFVTRALTAWQKTPRWVVLMGGASSDPRNYLGLGIEDFVPTRLVDTQYLETASDDWFVDANNDGLPDLALGRLPARTAAEAGVLVSKLDAYRRQPHSADWLRKVLLVSDENDAHDFEYDSEAIRADLGTGAACRTAYRGQEGTAMARTDLLAGINAGAGIVNYFGHGSITLWRDNLLAGADVAALTNAAALPVFLSMTCLNGLFTDLYSEPLGAALVKAPNGGAVAVWASTGLTEPAPQFLMAREAYRQLRRRGATLGEALAAAKRATDDPDVRRTWVLLGDPTLASPLAELVAPDTTPPVISAVSSGAITPSSAVISWSTDEDSDSQVEYGPTTAYGSRSTVSAAPVRSHSVALTGLASGTLYHYRVRSSDAAGNPAVSGDYTLTTESSPDATVEITSVTMNAVTANSAIVVWVTSQPADTQVEYGTTPAYGRITALDSYLAKTHSALLDGLSPDTAYHLRVRSHDGSGSLALSGDYTFRTLSQADTTPPVITAVTIRDITSGSAIVTWSTSEAATGQAEFGTTTSYGRVTVVGGSLTLEHESVLTGLSPNTTYHVRVQSADGSGNVGCSRRMDPATSRFRPIGRLSPCRAQAPPGTGHGSSCRCWRQRRRGMP
jgi:hypothetical protein